MTSLVEERDSWRKNFENGIFTDFHYYKDIVEYRENRNSNLWRSAKAYEELLEYINWLEEKADIKQNSEFL